MKDYINSFRTKLADTISKQQIEPVRFFDAAIDLDQVSMSLLFYFQLVYDTDGRPYQIASGKNM